MLAEESLLGLSSLLVKQEDQPAQSTHAQTTTALTPASELVELLTSLGLTPTGSTSPATLLRLLRDGGHAAVDARLRESGIKSVGVRLKIKSAVSKAASSALGMPTGVKSSGDAQEAGGRAVPPPAAPPPGPPPPSTDEVLEDAARDGVDVPRLQALIGGGAKADLAAVSAELKELGYKTGPRLRLERALLAAANTAAAAENERIVRQARVEAAEAYERERRERAAAQAAAAAAAAREAAEARAQAEAEWAKERAALYEQYQRETMSEVDKLKERRRAERAERRRAQQQEEEEEGGVAVGAEESAAAAAGERAADDHRADDGPLIVDADANDGGEQGLAWVRNTLRCDADGDEAHTFMVLERDTRVKV